MTQREKVLSILQRANGAPVCGNALDDAVGRRAGARVWDLRRLYGFDIKSEDCYCARCNRAAQKAKRESRRFSRVAAYRLMVAGEKAA